MHSNTLIRCLACLILVAAGFALIPTARADDANHCKNPDWAPQSMPGFVIDSCETRAWASQDVDLTSGSKRLQGERITVEYVLKDPSKNPTANQARDFNIAAGKKFGATLRSDPDLKRPARSRSRSVSNKPRSFTPTRS